MIVSFKFLDLETIFRVPSPPMLIEQMLPKGGVMGITAHPGTGKTFLCLEACDAIVTGGKFLGKFQAQPGAALFVGQDASVYDYAGQFRKLVRYRFLEFEDKVLAERAACTINGNTPVLTNPYRDNFLTMIQPGLLLDDAAQVRKFIDCVNEYKHGPVSGAVWQEWDPELNEIVEHDTTEKQDQGFDVIVLDTLSAMKHADENSNTEMEVVFRNLRAIADGCDAAVILIHHNGHDGDKWRGATSQWGALDSWLQLKTAKDGVINATFKKFRGLKPEPFNYRMDTDEDTATLSWIAPPAPAFKMAGIEDATLQQIYNSTGPITKAAIVAGVRAGPFSALPEGLASSSVAKSLAALRKDGAIEKVGKDGWQIRGGSRGSAASSGDGVPEGGGETPAVAA